MAERWERPPRSETAGKALPVWARVTIQMSLALAVAAALLIPNVAEVGSALDAVESVELRLALLGTLLQAAAIGSQAMLTRASLPGEEQPAVPSMIRIELAAMAASHTVPGGTAAGTALGFRLLNRAGVRKADAGFAVGMRGIGSTLVLNGLLWAALLVSIPLRGLDPIYSLVAFFGVVILGGVGFLAYLLVRREEATTERLQRVASHVPFVNEETVPQGVERVADHLRTLASDRSMLAKVAGWAGAYWLLDAAALGTFITAFGSVPRPDALFVAYGMGALVAVIPITPRGLGTLEATVITLLSALGVDRDAALLGVLTWRLVNFWAPIPIGGLAYLSLRAWPPKT